MVLHAALYRTALPKGPGSDEFKASSQAHAQPAEPFFKQFQGETDNKSDNKCACGTPQTYALFIENNFSWG